VTTPTPDPCYYRDGAGCGDCNPDLDMSPAGIVRRAVSKLGSPGAGTIDAVVADKLAELLQILGDDMSDEHAEEVERPQNLPQFRWQVAGDRGRDYPSYQWTAALALARAILDLPDPNLVNAGGAR
jgi:hypothetical protein